MRPASLLVVLALPFVVMPAVATAAPPADAATPPPAPFLLELDVPVTLGVAAGGGLAWILSESLFKSALAPATCRWCDRDAAGVETLNPLDRWGRGLAAPDDGGRRTWARVSDVLVFGVVPASVLALTAYAGADSGTAGLWLEDALLVAEAGVLAAVLNQATKFAVGRERPFVHVLPAAQKGLTDHPSDNNLSFYSGHASFAFALAVSAGTVAELRGYEARWLVWAGGLTLAASLPLLRMAADKHYLSDVAVGSLVGAAVGFAVPFFLHPRVGGTPIAVAAGPDGVTVGGRF